MKSLLLIIIAIAAWNIGAVAVLQQAASPQWVTFVVGAVGGAVSGALILVWLCSWALSGSWREDKE